MNVIKKRSCCVILYIISLPTGFYWGHRCSWLLHNILVNNNVTTGGAHSTQQPSLVGHWGINSTLQRFEPLLTHTELILNTFSGLLDSAKMHWRCCRCKTSNLKYSRKKREREHWHGNSKSPSRAPDHSSNDVVSNDICCELWPILLTFYDHKLQL